MTPEPTQPDWPEAIATVLTCRYDARVGRAIAFGLPSTRRFRITYNYWANGELHEGQCFSDKAHPQGTLFPIRYDPNLPHRSRGANAPTAPRPLWIAFAFAGVLVAASAWLLALRSCSPAR